MIAGRAQDDRLLAMVAARASGLRTSEIAARFGITTQTAAIQTNKVMDADLWECKEPLSAVIPHYWPRRDLPK